MRAPRAEAETFAGAARSERSCVVGATGGSGTRVVARLTRCTGIFIGSWRNESEDAIEIGRFLDQWVPSYIASVHQNRPMPPELVSAMSSQWEQAMKRHLDPKTRAGEVYGFERAAHPLSPAVLARALPGLDATFSYCATDARWRFHPIKINLRRYGDLMLPRTSDALPMPVQSIALWKS